MLLLQELFIGRNQCKKKIEEDLENIYFSFGLAKRNI